MTTPKILVSDYMKPVSLHFSATDSVEHAAEALLKHKVLGAPVLDDKHRLVGFVSQQDCIKQMLNDSYYSQDHEVVADIMRTDPVSVPPDMDIMDLAEAMVGNRPKLYPVLENGTVIGMVTRTDVLAALVSFRKSATNRV